MNQIYHFLVYTLNTRSTGISLFLTAKNVIFSFHAVVWPAKRQLYVCSKFGTTKYVSRAFSYWFLAWKYVISDKVYNLTCTCVSTTYLVVLSPRKTSFLFLLLAWWGVLTFFITYLEDFNLKYIDYTLLVCRQRPKMQLLLFRKHFKI